MLPPRLLNESPRKITFPKVDEAGSILIVTAGLLVVRIVALTPEAASIMTDVLSEVNRVLKDDGSALMLYSHKTFEGWKRITT